MTTMTSDFKTFVSKHVELLAAGDARAMVENDYDEDAVMVLMVSDPPQVIRGRAALTELFTMYLRDIYRGVVAMRKVEITEDSICLEATILTTSGEAGVWDALYMKDGRIYRHYSGLK